MMFASADYPLFLIAVFFLYGLLRRGRAGALAARLGLLCLLFDLIYLLLSKNVASLWDPLGALFFRAVIRLKDPPALRSPAQYAAGVLLFCGGLWLGARRGRWLDGPRGQAVLGQGLVAALALLGFAVLWAFVHGQLEALSRAGAAYGHLVLLGPHGVAVGACLLSDHPCGQRFGRLLGLLLVSAIFYHSWAAGMPGAYKYLLSVILLTIVLDYYLALWIDGAQARWLRRALLVASLVSNLGILSLFKYFDFFLGTVKTAVGWLGGSIALEPFALILPAGISFHTFQSLSYTIDVYKRHIRATRSVVSFATFVLFFPQLVAGPIVRARDFLPQLDGEPVFCPQAAQRGLFRILLGLVKKIALGDLLALYLVDRVFTHPSRYSAIEVLMAIYGYALQIYLDFSAYSDIAIGSAALLGFTLPENFAAPYRAVNLQDFWRRWHITLSTWLRDYVYIPLHGSQGPPWLTYRNLLLTMLLGGLWHGASWTFILWGALHGGGQAMTRIFQRVGARIGLGLALLWAGAGLSGHLLLLGASDQMGQIGEAVGLDAAWLHLVVGWAYLTPAWAALSAWLSRQSRPLYRGAAMVLTFHYVCLGWVFFRAPSFAMAREVLAQLGTWSLDAQSLQPVYLLVLGVAVLAHLCPASVYVYVRDRFVALPPWAKAGVMVLCALSLRQLKSQAIVPFIYFQF